MSGLVANVGVKTAPHEYLGIRGAKFSIFPASALHQSRPQWIMAAEIVETSRLYARTVAGIKPQALERVAAHLVSRTYSEPRWQSDSAHVVANEKVSLGGLVLAPRRVVHYGPVDSVVSRQIFILHALVEGDFKSSAPFLSHNQRQADQITRLENRLRRRNLLADPEARYAFYDRKIPPGIYNGPLFEKWRRQAEHRDPRLLFMRSQELLRGNIDADIESLYPDRLQIGPLALQLDYRFDVELDDDGVTAIVPLPAVNQLQDEAVEWLIPGWLPEKIEALMRTLPRLARTQFVPIPEFARKAAVEIKPVGRGLAATLAAYLSGYSQVPIHVRDMNADELPAYLCMNIRVVDPQGRVVTQGRDLDQVRKAVGLKAREAFAQNPDPRFHRNNVRDWNFGDLSPSVDIRQAGVALIGYPALVESGDSVHLRLLDDAGAAAIAHAAGVRRLFMMQAAGELKYLSTRLPHIEQMCLNFASVGSGDSLKQDITGAIAREVFADMQSPIRTREEFKRTLETAWPRMSAVSIQIASALRPALESYADLAAKLAKTFPILMQPSIADMQEQLRWLIFPEFVSQTPLRWLQQIPRFLQGIAVRLNKLTNSGLGRDQANLHLVLPPWQAYIAAVEIKSELAMALAELDAYRWMIEEYRISLFAQELKTSQPISSAKLEAQWVKIHQAR